ncbi:MAG: Protein SphX [Myxococcota bacterium]|nr:Protein SphX [Myxococcota bacterium]
MLSRTLIACSLLLLQAGCHRSVVNEVISLDGSSTVHPLNEAVAEEFQKTNRRRITLGVSGTGGGFKKFCNGEVAIVGASRPIKPPEAEQCGRRKIEYVELPVAYDGIIIIVHPSNTWMKSITVSQLKKIWAPEAQNRIKRWNQVDPSWPDEEMHLFGAGVDSGTYDYFTEAVVGKSHSSRGDYTSSEDDNVLVKGVSTDPQAMGFLGMSFMKENDGMFRVVPVDGEGRGPVAGPVAPSHETVADGIYAPLSRPLFIYVNVEAAKSPSVEQYITYYLGNMRALAEDVGYVGLPDDVIRTAQDRFRLRRAGTIFGSAKAPLAVLIKRYREDTPL